MAESQKPKSGEGQSFSFAEFAREVASEHGLDASALTGRDIPPTKGDVEKEYLLKKAEANTPASPEILGRETLQEQYENQIEILYRVGVLSRLKSGESGIMDIEGMEHAVPTFAEIAERIERNKKEIEKKEKQGFTKLLIVPFGMKLSILTEKYKAALLKHAESGKLFAEKSDPGDPDELIELNKNEPVYMWSEYEEGDVDDSLVYFPKEFSDNHGGRTKQEMLNLPAVQRANNVPEVEFPAWEIMLVEDQPIPAEGTGLNLAGRDQIEAGSSANEYLELLRKNIKYLGEEGLTPESWLMLAITKLEEDNQVIDDWQGKGKFNMNLAAYFPGAGYVADADWYRDGRQARLGGGTPDDRDSGIGARSAVRI